MTGPVRTWEDWRVEAREHLARGIPPSEISWHDAAEGQPSLFSAPPPHAGVPVRDPTVPARFLELGPEVACHADPVRWHLLYSALWRLTHGEPSLLDVAADPLVARLGRFARAVRRDIHKMRAFVRFQRVEDGEGECWVSWFEPDHHVVERNARFFVDRFTSMRFSIFTPHRSLHWDRATLWFDAGARRDEVVGADGVEDAWRVYYASTYNPARTRWKAMVSEMPARYWKNLPEARVIAALTLGSQDRVERMLGAGPAPDEAEQRRARRDHSARRASTGSTRAARRAGR